MAFTATVGTAPVGTLFKASATRIRIKYIIYGIH